MSSINIGSILSHHVLEVLLGMRNFLPFLDMLFMGLNKISQLLLKKIKK
jgi:hypothetical protein